MYSNPLSQAIIDRVSAPLELAIDSSYDDLEDIQTLEGQSIGQVRVYRGKRLQKLVVSEFVTGPGMVASLVVIKPDYHFDVPRFGSDFSMMGEKLHLDTDLFPHRDLAMGINYMQQYYAPLENGYLQASKDYGSVSPNGLWLRNFVSPYFFMADAEPTEQDALQKLALQYLNCWINIWQQQTTAVSDTLHKHIVERADIFEKLSLQHNPVKALFNSILGEPLTARILKTLY